MRSPAALDPAAYPIVPGVAPDLFPWPRVKDDRNMQGATAVAVPGVVAGMGLAHERFGRMPWREVLAPSIRLAAEGLLLDWYSGLLIASTARALSMDPDAAALFLDEGQWAPLSGWTVVASRHLNQQVLGKSLEAIAREGPKALYGGDVGAALVKDLRAKGGGISLSDFSGYKAELADPLDIPYHGGRIYAAPGFTGGPALVSALKQLPEKPGYSDYARALDKAWRARLQNSGDSCTTHFTVVDREGNFCSVTQTLLSMFGSRCVSPSTGILLNNGLMWFDPEPGKPNSLGPSKRCLGNYCPILGATPNGERFALGGAGGRKIVGAVLQIASFLIDHGATLEDAFHRPRIDMSGGERVVADIALPPDELRALEAAFPVVTARRTIYPDAFARPSAVLRSGGMNMGCTEVMSPWADTVHENSGSGR
jgi:gamma-glutamyltranspeptidase/glutathione hydrolase